METSFSQKASRTLLCLVILVSICLHCTSLQAQFLFTSKFGSNTGGQTFSLPDSREKILNLNRITRLSIQHTDRRIEKIQVHWLYRDGSSNTESTGEADGTWDHLDLAKDEYIISVQGRSGTLIDQLTFRTNKRRTFGPFGGTGGNTFNLAVPADSRVVGFYGRSGQAIDQFGLIYLKSSKERLSTRVESERKHNGLSSNKTKKDNVYQDNLSAILKNERIQKREILKDGTIKLYYTGGYTHVIPFEKIDYIVDTKGDTLYKIINMYLNTQAATEPALPPGFVAYNSSETNQQWLTELNAWLEDHNKRLLERISMMMEHDEERLKLYQNFEDAKNITLYEKINLRYYFLTELSTNGN
jgi:hypothetical protein